ncbi:peptidoglycan-binding protein [Tessaracoccus sp. MC1756]|uniref:peptidoglycan-binding protein n=1 Tax=Tessaracoccus sp. MC1756 TaxID=2760311 RepID=UPI0016017A60|nr:peptidoglycan-binding protein [Tessaracoccus sp. MC1756]MBB1508691.1 peptidoglycan-binding protein [Tessaracoccus sp. MC1756]
MKRWLKLAAVAVVLAVVAVPMLQRQQEAAGSTASDFIAKLVKDAQQTEREFGIPASVTIGMAALETGWGRSSMTGQVTADGVVYDVNTLFNIKCTSTVSPFQTGCVPIRTAEYRSDGTKYYIVDEFRTYASWLDSTRDFARLLTTLTRYAPAFQYVDYPDQFVTEVRKGGYATDPKYSELVISIMRSHNLYQYNLRGQGPGYPEGMDPNGPTPPVTTVDPYTMFPQLLVGSRGDTVRSLQRLLNTLEAGIGVDGIYGSQTTAAVSAFQRAQKLTVTGKVDDATWQALLPELASGAKGEGVRVLQTHLQLKGGSVAITGSFDAATDKALRAFQQLHRIEGSGHSSYATWARLLG